jgi:thiaminase/transcriptional activator TenA
VRYLIQNHRFLDCFLTLLGPMLASAETFEAKLRFISMVSVDDNIYFPRAFKFDAEIGS